MKESVDTVEQWRHEERVDKNVWRFLLAAFAFLVTCLIGLLVFSASNYINIINQQQSANARQDITLTVLESQQHQLSEQLLAQQKTMATLALTVQAIHDEVTKNTTYRETARGRR